MAALGQLDRRRQAGDAAADDRHVALDAAFQAREGLRTLHRGGVVGVLCELAVGAQEAHGMLVRQALDGDGCACINRRA